MLSKTHKINSIWFNNLAWRELLTTVCDKIDVNKVGLEVISPFGFELLEDSKSLTRPIRRLYCYIGIPSKSSCVYNKSYISEKFSEQLISSLHTIDMSKSDVAVLVTQEKFHLLHNKNYRCTNADKLIDIQTRIVNDNILLDYSNYIICTVDSLFSEKDEPQYFFENKRHRCRTYQLYVMLEKLLGYLLPPMNIFQKESYYKILKLIDNSIQMFYDPAELNIIASHFEMHLLTSLIKPRIGLMFDAVKGNSTDNLIKLNCDAYHVEGRLELCINQNIYIKAVNKIKDTYLKCV